jgi:hypothetical protein
MPAGICEAYPVDEIVILVPGMLVLVLIRVGI